MTLQQQQQPPTGTYLLPSPSQLDAVLAEQSARLHNGLCSSGGCEWCVRRARVATRLRDLCDDFDREYFGGRGGRGDEKRQEEEEQEREEPSLVASAFTKIYTAIFTRFFS